MTQVYFLVGFQATAVTIPKVTQWPCFTVAMVTAVAWKRTRSKKNAASLLTWPVLITFCVDCSCFYFYYLALFILLSFPSDQKIKMSRDRSLKK